MATPDYTRCRYCGHRWMGLPLGWQAHYRAGDPLPGVGNGLKCPKCGLNGSSVVVDFEPQVPLPL